MTADLLYRRLQWAYPLIGAVTFVVLLVDYLLGVEVPAAVYAVIFVGCIVLLVLNLRRQAAFVRWE